MPPLLLNGHYHIEKIIIFLLSQICSCPIQIDSRWIQISQRQQQSKNQFLYTDERQTQEYIHKVCFLCIYVCLYEPLMVIESVEIKNYEYMWDRVVVLCEVQKVGLDLT
jgi:hypothetical protein